MDNAAPFSANLPLQVAITGSAMSLNWHSGPISRATPLDAQYRNTQKVRQFLIAECGEAFKFDRTFMAWIKSGAPATMGDVADEWLRTPA